MTWHAGVYRVDSKFGRLATMTTPRALFAFASLLQVNLDYQGLTDLRPLVPSLALFSNLRCAACACACDSAAQARSCCIQLV
jgi:hypothetical protein